ncbi:putative Na+/H+ antiporter [Haloferula sargassicola]|uniref:Na+/H+ antiporter n=1 Tax=Haloferula sargassicola TaxID=490096 RepID=A0ABP9USW6_9BACT
MKHLLLLFISLVSLSLPTFAASGHSAEPPPFKVAMDNFSALEEAAGKTSIMEKISFRAHEEPFLLVATIIFICAILHTFFAVPITKLAHKIQHDHDAEIRRQKEAAGQHAYAQDMVSFKATVLHFLGEIEAIFGIWVIVLVGAMMAFYNVDAVESYMSSVNFTEPMFVVVIMALASTRPVLRFAENCLRLFAKIGKETPTAWWLSILIIGPLLGSFITEPGAMTISAMLLAKKFYSLRPSPRFAYGTLGLLFVNISVGGVLTNFAAPPVLMVASPEKWGLTTTEMITHFGDKAVLGILSSTILYFLFFRKELTQLGSSLVDHDGDGKGDLAGKHRPIPLWVTIVHLFFMAVTVYFAHFPSIFIGGFLFFLAFRLATAHYQDEVNLRGPILVGFFLSGLVIHGGLQGWWLAPILSSLPEWPLFIGATVLTSFNDNAAITFLASQVPGLAAHMKYAVLTGAVTGGGLTVIANAPNPAGQALLGRFFGDGVSPAKLAAAAIIPTFIVGSYFMLFPDRGIDKMFEQPPAVEHAEAAPDAATPEPAH